MEKNNFGEDVSSGEKKDCGGEMSSGGCADCSFLSGCMRSNHSRKKLLPEDVDKLMMKIPLEERDIHRDGCLD